MALGTSSTTSSRAKPLCQCESVFLFFFGATILESPSLSMPTAKMSWCGCLMNVAAADCHVPLARRYTPRTRSRRGRSAESGADID